jgi:hypothetical protein
MVYNAFIVSVKGQARCHPEQPGRLAARLLADDPDIKTRHFGDVISTGKLLSPDVYFQIETDN